MRLYDFLSYGISTLERYQNGEIPILLSGLQFLDDRIPLIPGSTNYIAARPGQGKTYMINSIYERMVAKYKSALLYAEDSKENTSIRLLSHFAKGAFTSFDAYKKKLRDDQWQRITQTMGRVGASDARKNGIIEDVASWDIDKLIDYLAKLEAAGCQVVMLDYMQKIQSKKKDDLDKFVDISEKITAFFKISKMVFLGVFQLNRAGDKTHNPNQMPSLAEIHGSSSFEKDAHSICMLQRLMVESRDSNVNKYEESDNYVFSIRKNRNGGILKTVVIDRFYNERRD